MNPRARGTAAGRQRGASSLFITVILVLVVMLLAVTAAVLSSTQFKLAGNLQYENIAFNLAEGALASAENWLSTGHEFQERRIHDALERHPAALPDRLPRHEQHRSADDDVERHELAGGRRRRHQALPGREVRRRQPAAGNRAGLGRPRRSPAARRWTCSGSAPAARARRARPSSCRRRTACRAADRLTARHSETEMQKGPTMKTPSITRPRLILACLLGLSAIAHGGADLRAEQPADRVGGRGRRLRLQLRRRKAGHLQAGLHQGKLDRQPLRVPGHCGRHRSLRRGRMERRRRRRVDAQDYNTGPEAS